MPYIGISVRPIQLRHTSIPLVKALRYLAYPCCLRSGLLMEVFWLCPGSRRAERIAGSGSAHPAPPMRGGQGVGDWQLSGDAAGEPDGSAEGSAHCVRTAPGGGVSARALSGNARRGRVSPRMGKRGGDGSSQVTGSRMRARRMARRARGVGSGALRAAGRAESTTQAAHEVRGSAFARLERELSSKSFLGAILRREHGVH